MADSQVLPPSVQSYPRCLGCGFTVDKVGDVCVECADKPQFQGKNVAPKAMIETAPQPEPPYLTQGNFARPQPREFDEDAL